MPQCKYCRQDHPILKFGDEKEFCTAGCEFQNFHWYEMEKVPVNKRDNARWTRLALAHNKEQEALTRENKINRYMKSNGTHEKPLITQQFKSKSTHDKVYTTMLFETFEICDCKGFVNNHKCWHVDKLMEIYKLFN